MNNKIYKVTAKQYAEIEKDLKDDPRIYTGKIDGASIRTKREFLDAVWVAFDFPVLGPYGGYKNMDAYLDWIRDLEWLGADGYAFVVLNFSDLMRSNELREEFSYYLEHTVIPWWNEEVSLYRVGGKPKPFNVYLVD